MSKLLRRLPLQTVLAVPLIVIVVLTGGLAGMLAVRNGQAEVTDLVHQLHLEVAHRTSQHLDIYLATPHLVNRLNREELRLGHLDWRDLDGLERHFLAQIPLFGSVNAIDFANEQREYVAALQEVLGVELGVARADDATGHALNDYDVSAPGRRALILSVPGYDPRPRPWYQAAVRAGQPTWTPIYLWSSGEVGLDAVMPIYADDGRLLGVLSTSLTLDHIGGFLRELGNSGQDTIFIVDQSGTLVASSTLTQTFTRTGTELTLTSAAESADPLVQAASRAVLHQAGSWAGVRGEQFFAFNLAGRRQSALIAPYEDAYGLKWLIVTLIPEAAFMTQIEASNRTTLGLILLAIIIAVACAILTARWITQPLLRLQHAAQALARGDWAPTEAVDRQDEIGDLARSIGQMAAQLRETFNSLQSSEARFRLLAENSTDMISRHTPEGAYLYASPACRNLLGYAPEELVGHSAFEFIQADDVRAVEQARTAILQDRAVQTTTYRARTKAGGAVWLETSSHTVPDPHSGSTLEIHAVTRDVTPRLRAEAALQQSETRYRTLFEMAQDAIFMMQGDRFVDCNPATQRLFACRKEEIIGRTPVEFSPALQPDGRASAEKALEKIQAALSGAPQTFEWRHCHLNGAEFDAEVSLGRLDLEGASFVQAIVRDVTERKHAEAALRESEERYRALFDDAPIPLIEEDLSADRAYLDELRAAGVHDLRRYFGEHPEAARHCLNLGRAVRVNAAAHAWQGVPISAAAPVNLGQMIGPSGEQDFVDELLMLAEGQNRYEYVTRRGEQPASQTHMIVSGSVAPGCEHSWARVILSFVDISERVRAEEAARASERMARAMLDTSFGLAGLLTAEGTLLEANQTALEFVGAHRADVVGKLFWDTPWWSHSAEMQAQLRQAVAAAASGQLVRFEAIHRARDGAPHTIDFSLKPLLDDAGRVVLLIPEGRDITERKRAEEALWRTKNYLDNILNSMPSLVVGVDAAGRVTHWNQRAGEVTGVTLEQAIGRPLEEVLPQTAGYQAQVGEAVRDRQPRMLEKVATLRSGERRYEDVLVFPLVANGVEGAVIRVDDVTERTRLEELMIQTEKMMMVGGLAAGMAHEINNPLGGILQAAQNIERRLSAALPANQAVAEALGLRLETVRNYLERRDILAFLADIREAGLRASRIVANMLQFSRRSDMKKCPTSLSDLLDHAVELAASDYDLKKRYDFRHIEVVRDYDPALPKVLVAPTEIEQVILNLLRNAAHALLERRTTAAPRITLRAQQAGGFAVIQVADNGCGMEETVRKRVFEPFFTTKEVGSGTGLGLSVSYMIVTNNHKGTIEVESAPGKGTTFTLRLPLESSD